MMLKAERRDRRQNGRRRSRPTTVLANKFWRFTAPRGLAGIFHGIRSRVVRGTAVSAEARRYAGFTDTICDLAWAQARRAGAL